MAPEDDELPTTPFTASPADSETDVWLVSFGETDDRELSSGEIAKALKAGEITEQTLVWREGMAEWKTIANADDLNTALIHKAQGAAAPAAAAPSTPDSPTDAPAEPKAGSLAEPDEEPPVSSEPATLKRPSQRPTVEAEEPAPESAQPLSSSELEFVESQDGRRMPVLPTAPKLGLDSFGGLDGDAPSDHVAESVLLESRPPRVPSMQVPRDALNFAPPSSRRPPVVASPPTASVEKRSKSDKKPVSTAPPSSRRVDPAEEQRRQRGLMLAGLLVVGGAAGYLLTSFAGNRAAPAEEAQALTTPATTDQTETQPAELAEPEVEPPSSEPAEETDEDEPDTEPSEATAKTAATAALTAPSQPSKPSTTAAATSKSPTEPKATAPSTQASKPATEEKKEEKKEEATPDGKETEVKEVSTAGPFNTAAAASALREAAARAASCRKEGEPSGVAQVSVTFASSGRATRAIIGGPPFAGTATGSCIASVMRTASVPAFSGDLVTVRKKVVIQ